MFLKNFLKFKKINLNFRLINISEIITINELGETMNHNMEKIVEQAKKMQEEMKKIRTKIKESETQGESGAGLVKVTMTGRYNVKKFSIDENLIKDESKETIEELLAAALNNAVCKIEKRSKNYMSELTGEFGIPNDSTFFQP